MALHFLLFLVIFAGVTSARPQSSDFDFEKLPESEEHYYQIERQDDQQYPNYDYDYQPAEPVTKVGQGKPSDPLFGVPKCTLVRSFPFLSHFFP